MNPNRITTIPLWGEHKASGPKIQSTTGRPSNLSHNEVFEHIHRESKRAWLNGIPSTDRLPFREVKGTSFALANKGMPFTKVCKRKGCGETEFTQAGYCTDCGEDCNG